MTGNKRSVGSVTSRDAEHGYFDRRKLRRHAAFWSRWALGVGAVISGDFDGWNLGLDAGGAAGRGQEAELQRQALERRRRACDGLRDLDQGVRVYEGDAGVGHD